jgi:hypothetical protein
LSDVRRAHARSRKVVELIVPLLVSWHSIADRFQVNVYSGDPSSAKFTANLLAKDNRGAALPDEPEELWPEVPGVVVAFAFPCLAVRLAGAAPGPHGPVGWPSCEAEGEGPSGDTGEEMALFVVFEFVRLDIRDTPLVDVSLWDLAGVLQVH